MTRLWSALLLAVALPATAYETDQLTDREIPLPDVAPRVEERVDQMMATAIRRANAHTRCRGSDEKVRDVLAAAIHAETAVAHPVHGRGIVRSQGYHRIDAWMEETLPGRYFGPKEGIYADVGLFDSLILHTAGSNSTYRVADEIVGSDKIAHFFDLGYAYYRWSKGGIDIDRAVRRGTGTERTIYGMFTSNTFSFADLRANFDGYRFYVGLLERGSAFQRGEDGCVVQVRPWRWSEWVDPEWDEVENPSMYTRKVQAAVTERLTEEKDELCASYEKWADPDYPARLQRTLSSRPVYVRGYAPVREDPFDLPHLCKGEAVSAAGAARRRSPGAAWHADDPE